MIGAAIGLKGKKSVSMSAANSATAMTMKAFPNVCESVRQ